MKILFSLILPFILYMTYKKYVAKKPVSIYSAVEFSILIFLLNYFVVIISNHNPNILERLSTSVLYFIKYNAMSVVVSAFILLSNSVLNKTHNSKLKKISNLRFLFEALLCGAAIFTAIYGVRILNPLYTDWLIAGGDLTQHYLGWCFFRVSDWQFPIGLYDGLSYPYSTSIIYTDSIPLFAVFFKLISFALPENFQYFGLWGIMCFSLQCMLGAVICKKHTDKNIITLLSGILLTVSPVMIWRMFAHTSLAGHWIILLSWLPVIYTDKFEGKKRTGVFWLLVGVLCCFIHLYFLPLCGISLCAYILKRCINGKKFYAILNVLAYVGGGLLAIELLGGFNAGANYGAGGFGTYGSNLNTYFNTQGNAILFANSGYYGNGQYEGFGYLGAGILILSIIALIAAVQEFLDRSDFASKKRILANMTPYMLVFLLSTILATIPDIAYNDQLIFEIQFPELVTRLMSVFRANGRFIWGGVYAISIASLVVLLKKYKSNMVFIILTACIILQFYDLSEWISGKYNSFSSEKYYESLLQDAKWEQISNMGFEHIYISKNIASDQAIMYSIAKWAVENDMTMNRFYFARGINGVSEAWADKIENPESTDIFIFAVKDYADYAGMENLYILDDFIIGSASKIPCLEELDTKQYVMDVIAAEVFSGNENTEMNEDGMMVCHNGGIIYGPYLTVPGGNYCITYYGDNLKDCTFDCVCSQGSVSIETTMASATSNEITYEISLGKRTEKVEFRLFNHNDNAASLYQVKLEGFINRFY